MATHKAITHSKEGIPYPYSEMIWQGRIHLGDEPGIFGDAQYSGLCVSLPFTIEVSQGQPGSNTILIAIEAENVHTFDPYPGHSAKVIRYYPVDPSKPNGPWGRNTLTEGQLKEGLLLLPVDLSGITDVLIFLSLSLEVDTTVRAGLYNDFVFTRLTKYAQDFKYSASFGFMVPL